MDDTADDKIVDADVVDSTPTDNQATVLKSLEEMIKKYITRFDVLKIELKKQKETYDDSFLNNPTYLENFEKAKAAEKSLSVTRKSIASQPSVIQIALKLKSMRDEYKETDQSLSDYLQEFQRLTGANEIEGEDGKIRDIVNKAKLILRSGK
jgi:hypothetical protein